MKCISLRFLHAADIHLGYQQYGSAERYNDFALAFGHLVDDALARRVDYLLLAGDLFHQRTVDPGTLLQATHHLRRLRDAGIPVIAVEGNHERPHYLEKLSWLDYLAETGLLIVLTPAYQAGVMVLERWNEHDRMGAYIDLPGGVRVIGAKYFGAATGRVLQDLHHALPNLPGERPAYTILMLHAGIQGILDHYSATVSRAQLDVLRPYVDYLALGHIHKPFIQDDWIYNPGSIETVSMTEVEWDDRGYFIVEVYPVAQVPLGSIADPTARRHAVTRVRSRRRAFERLHFPVDRFDSPEELHRGLARFLEEKATPEKATAEPVVELHLFGVLGFDRAELDLGRLEAMTREAFRAVVCRVRDVTERSAFDIRISDSMSRADLERHVLRELIERDVRRLSDSATWADLTVRLKQLALSGGSPEEILNELRAFRAAPPEGPPGGPSGGTPEASEEGGGC
jgi:DNA repair protein SbcD/Mre11